MAFKPISNTVPQYYANSAPASGYYLKGYLASTVTPVSMATDSTGATTLVKCQINSAGYPVNGSNAVFIPHFNVPYKLALYSNATDADNNTTANAIWVTADLYPWVSAGTAAIEYLSNHASFAAAISAIGSTETTLYVDIDGTVGTITTPATLNIQPMTGNILTVTGTWTCNSSVGYANFKWLNITTGSIAGRPVWEPSIVWFGAIGDNSTNNNDAFTDIEASSATTFYVPEGTYICTLSSLSKTYRGPGTIKLNSVNQINDQDFVYQNATAGRCRIQYKNATDVYINAQHFPMTGFRFHGNWTKARGPVFSKTYTTTPNVASLSTDLVGIGSVINDNWYAVFACANPGDAAAVLKIVPFFRAYSVAGSVVTLGQGGEADNAAPATQTYTGTTNNSFLNCECLVINETIDGRVNNWSGRVTTITANNTTSVTLATIGAVAAQDYLLPAPPGYAHYRYLGSFYQDSAEIRNIADTGTIVYSRGVTQDEDGLNGYQPVVPSVTAWAQSTAYNANDVRLANNRHWKCKTSGTSTTGSGPNNPADIVIGTDGLDYRCINNHTSAAGDRPITGGSYASYWIPTGGRGAGSTWVVSTAYTDEVTDGTAVWRDLGPATGTRVRLGGYISPLATAVRFAHSITYASATAGQVLYNYSMDSNSSGGSHDVVQGIINRVAVTTGEQTPDLTASFAFSQELYFAVGGALNDANMKQNCQIRGWIEP